MQPNERHHAPTLVRTPVLARVVGQVPFFKGLRMRGDGPGEFIQLVKPVENDFLAQVCAQSRTPSFLAATDEHEILALHVSLLGRRACTRSKCDLVGHARLVWPWI